MNRRTTFVAALAATGLATALCATPAAQASEDVLYVCHAQDTYVRAQPVGEIVGTIFHSQTFHRLEPTTPGGWIKGYAPAVLDGPAAQQHGRIDGYVDHDYVCTGPQD
ncbi:hypothetical protein [Amycolatopsis sp. NPDC049159]|uniref:hypothetical protein n=1 Tax=Amycolatopsis sp. NPDC049159 TaxID=3157210 RepID=UPI0033F038C6